jgi:hypothetical protein
MSNSNLRLPVQWNLLKLSKFISLIIKYVTVHFLEQQKEKQLNASVSYITLQMFCCEAINITESQEEPGYLSGIALVPLYDRGFESR